MPPKNSSITELNQTRLFLNRMNVPLPALWGSAFFSFLGVIFNYSGLQLLVPLGQGIIRNDYSSVRDHLGIVGFMHDRLPEFFRDPHTAFFPLAALILCTILMQNILDYYASIAAARQIKTAEKKLRSSIFSRLMGFGKKYFDGRGTSEIQQMLIQYPAAIAAHIRVCLKLLSQAMSLSAIFIFLIVLSWRLTLITLLILPFFFFFSQRTVHQIRESAKNNDKFLGGLQRRILNLILCLPLVKVYGAEKEEQKLFNDECETEAKNSLDIEKKTLLIKPVEDFGLFITLIAIAAALGFIRTAEASADISKYLVFFYTVQQALPRLRTFTDFKIQMARSQSALDDLQTIFDEADKFPVKSGKKIYSGLNESIYIKNLNFEYRPGKPVLRDINLTFECGKKTAVVGPTGAGKTTLFNLLLRLYDCPPASIFADQTDIRELETSSWLSRIAHVSQDSLLFDQTVFFNLTYGLNRDIPEKEAAGILRAVKLEKLAENLSMPVGERGSKLSGGEKQRLSLARALLKDAEIFMLDEATSALDAQTEKDIHSALETHAPGKTVIIIAHRLASILSADRIISLNNGSISEQGTLESLLKARGGFFKEWSIQNPGFHSNKSLTC